MAYKFQFGNARMSGSLTQEEGLNANSAGITAAGAIAGATSVDGSGDLTMGTITMTGFSVDADGDTALKSLAIDDSSTIGCDSDTDLITLASTKVTLAANAALEFADAGEKISRSGDGYLDILAGTKVNISGAVGMNSSLTVAGAVSGVTSLDGSGDLTMGTITMTGFAVDADGDTALKSLAVDDGSTVGCDSTTDLLTLAASSLTVKAGSALQFADAGEKISRSADGFLDILAGTKVNLSGAVGMNSSLAVAGAVTMNGAVTLGNAASDDITFTGAMASGIVPKTDSAYDLGSNSNRWSTIYVDNIVGADSKFDIEERSSGQTISAGTDFAVCTSGNG